MLCSASQQPFVLILYMKDFETRVEGGRAAFKGARPLPCGTSADRSCCSSSACPTKMVPIGAVKCSEGEGVVERSWAAIYYRKVSVVESLPGVSGLTSTLTQATFSWLFGN